MKKKIVLLLLIAICVCACALYFTACNEGVNVTYYLNENGISVKSDFYKLNDKSWSDSRGASGSYETDGEKITFRTELSGEQTEVTTGTIKDGIITVNSTEGNKYYVSDIHKHTYGDWKTTKEPTCTEKGIQNKFCTLCGKVTETRDLELKNHLSIWETVKEATCSEKGVQNKVCLICGMIEDTRELQLKEHIGAWQTIKEPTCAEKGTQIKICLVCEAEETRPITELPHNFDDHFDYDKNNHWYECKDCGFKDTLIPHNGENCTDCGYVFGDTAGLEYELSSTKDSYIVTGIGSATDTEIKIPATFKGLPVIEIGNSAFYCCSTITSLIIPDSITVISNYAFGGCSELSSITISINVNNDYYGSFFNINHYAFTGCTKLKDIYFSGTKKQWNQVRQGIGWNTSTGEYIVHCSDGDLSKILV